VSQKTGLLATLRRSPIGSFQAGAVAMVFVMLVPLPKLHARLLLTVQLTVSVLVLLTAIQIQRPVQFSVFPSVILF